ncbi:hypothetical protein [Chengkuizengella marina]|uniref:Uncharacterized protein n=1 Tax=Chengkuizengella marina TaxID=2507566 RepID=A0A6N9Q2K5_9BACL|nr:hypothetical protein [Chengkuizengella marina]NBI28578.1 hypothetical protein [Chengkuizengella marina]
MDTVIISISTNKVVGLNRDPQPFEYAIQNVYLENAQKTIYNIEQKQKFDEEGNVLYLLSQPQLEVNETITKIIETTETTDDPVTNIETIQIPLLDDQGNQKTYEKTVKGETIEFTDEPVIEQVWNEETETYDDIHKTDDEGNLLYWGQVPTGQMIPLFTADQVEVHQMDDEENLLYYKEIEETITNYEDQEPLEITEDHEEWTEELELAYEDIEVTEVITFKTHMTKFTYDDVMDIKSRPVPLTTEDELELLKEENANLIFDSLQKESQIEELESENATQFLDSLEKENQIEELESELAGLTLSLVEGGVI